MSAVERKRKSRQKKTNNIAAAYKASENKRCIVQAKMGYFK